MANATGMERSTGPVSATKVGGKTARNTDTVSSAGNANMISPANPTCSVKTTSAPAGRGAEFPLFFMLVLAEIREITTFLFS
jgi:hypothetical protein